MSTIQLWTLVFVVLTFSFYIYIAYRSRVKDTKGFYVASGGVPAPANGAAIAADFSSITRSRETGRASSRSAVRFSSSAVVAAAPRPMANASSISAKISGGPKLSATDASGGAKAVKNMFETVPPMNDATAAVTRARLARPCMANGRPSNVVATAVDAPGIPSVIELIAPPYMAP